MATKTQRVKVGLFLLICGGLMAAVILLLRGYYNEKGVSYALEFEESISGLYEGGIVTYLGVPVGKVREIFVTNANKPHVNIVIDPVKVQLYEGVEAQLVIYSFAAGTMSISLEGGHPISGELPPGSLIPVKKSILGSLSSDIEVLIDNMSGILESIDKGLVDFEPGTLTKIIDESYDLVKKVNTAVDDGKDLMAKGTDFIDEASTTITDLRTDVKEVLDEFVALSEELKPAIQDTRKLLTSSTEKIDQLDLQEMQANLSKVLENVAKLSDKLRETVEGLDDTTASILHETDNLEFTVRALSQDLQSTLNNASRLLEQLNRDPSALIRGQGEVQEK